MLIRIAAGRTQMARPGKGVLPVGLRGVGKTVLLNQFAAAAGDMDYAVGFIEAPESDELVSQLAIRIRSMLLELSARHRASRRLQHALAALASFTVHLPDSTRFSVGVNPARGLADSGNLDEDLTSLLVLV